MEMDRRRVCCDVSEFIELHLVAPHCDMHSLYQETNSSVAKSQMCSKDRVSGGYYLYKAL